MENSISVEVKNELKIHRMKHKMGFDFCDQNHWDINVSAHRLELVRSMYYNLSTPIPTITSLLSHGSEPFFSILL